LRPNKPPGGLQAQPPPQKKFWLRLRAARCWRAAGSMPPAAQAAPASGFAPQMPRGLRRWGSRMEEDTAAHRPLEMETASRRQSATTRVWGSIGSAEIFAEGTAHTTTK
jgi:hypothetical protein